MTALVNVDCRCKQARHVHGTYVTYVMDRCRCDPCRQAVGDYNRDRARWLGEFPRTPPPLVSGKVARRHVKALMAQGMGQGRIAGLAGIPTSIVGALVWGRHDRKASRRGTRRIRRETETALLGVLLDLADGAKVSAVEAEAIIAELVARGWSKAAIGRRVTSPNARSLQIPGAGGQVIAGTLRSLRLLLTEPVPARLHAATGRWYDPQTGHEWRHISPSTVGVPGERAPLRALTARGYLRCWVCGKPLVEHRIGQCRPDGRVHV